MTTTILIGDCRAEMAKLEPGSVHCVVTSPPYWGLRDYGIEQGIWGGDADCAHDFSCIVPAQKKSGGTQSSTLGPASGGNGMSDAGRLRSIERQAHDGETTAFCPQCSAWRGTFGLEPTYQLYVEHSVEIFRAVKRILRADGTLWLNLGDSYATGAGRVGERPGGGAQGDSWGGVCGSRGGSDKQAQNGAAIGPMTQPNRMPQQGLKAKDLCGIPWRVAFALQADGWYLRRDIIWHKPNPMPESTTDRCTTAHEYLFHFSKSERYFYDAEAIKEPASDYGRPNGRDGRIENEGARPPGTSPRTLARLDFTETGRNKRSVWTVSTKPFPEAHFATFPPDLIEDCVLAGTSAHGCCAECGAGWERIATSTLVPTAKAAHTFVIDIRDEVADDNDQGANRQKDGHRPGWINETRTLGFYPTCACSGLPGLPPYPPKPREEHFDGETMYQMALVVWANDCHFVTSQRTVLCASAKSVPVKPAAVFDPFFGAGTTGLVAQRLNRNAIGCELNPDYAKMAQARLEADKMTKESGRRHMAKSLNKEKPWTAETLFAPTGTGNHHAGTNAEGDSTGS